MTESIEVMEQNYLVQRLALAQMAWLGFHFFVLRIVFGSAGSRRFFRSSCILSERKKHLDEAGIEPRPFCAANNN